jgi:hypothetical protein
VLGYTDTAVDSQGDNLLDAWFRKRLYLLIVCFAACLAALSFTVVTGHISNRGFGIVAVLLMVTFWAILTIFLYKARARSRFSASPPGTPLDTAARERLRRASRTFKVAMVLYPSFLVFGLFSARDLDMTSRLIGIGINIAITAYFYFAWRRVQAKLKNQGEVS